jgi:hypothetical protein
VKSRHRATAASADSLARKSRLRQPERESCVLTRRTLLEMTHYPLFGSALAAAHATSGGVRRYVVAAIVGLLLAICNADVEQDR